MLPNSPKNFVFLWALESVYIIVRKHIDYSKVEKRNFEGFKMTFQNFFFSIKARKGQKGKAQATET